MTTLAPNFLGVAFSLTQRRWRDRAGDPALSQMLAGQLGASPVAARLLAGRGATRETAEASYRPTLRALMPDPSCFADMDAAVEAILDAVDSGSSIAIFADYDVDGATSGALVARWLRAVGAQARVFVPDRIRDGYGPSPAAFRRLKAEGADLVITVDCGAAAYAALEEAGRIDLAVVVIDHHLMSGPPPPALAVVNPNRPDCPSGQGALTAAGVAFVLLAGLNREARARGWFADRSEPKLIEWLDLAALGTLCDVAPLQGLNRAFVAQGLKVLARGEGVGLKALAAAAKLERAETVYHATFVLGPRLNAGGRIGDSSLAVRLLATEDAAEAAELAATLDGLNAERRAVEALVLEEALQLIGQGAAGAETDPCLVVGQRGWHPGVIGIVAGRLKDRLRKPVVVIGTPDPDSEDAKGSGRSMPGVNLGAAIAESVKAGVIPTGGGHAMAAGVSLGFDRMDAFRADLNARLEAQCRAAAAADALDLDGLLSLAAVNRATIEEMEAAGPFGAGWPEPVFGFAALSVAYASLVGENHVRVALEDPDGRKARGVAFRAAGTPLGDALLNARGRRFHVAARLKKDDWRGPDGVDLDIVDAAIAS
jgi:single-stranded-DNA-specific exonuclease